MRVQVPSAVPTKSKETTQLKNPDRFEIDKNKSIKILRNPEKYSSYQICWATKFLDEHKEFMDFEMRVRSMVEQSADKR